MKTKQILLIIGIILISFSLIGCSKESTSSTTTEEVAPEEPKTKIGNDAVGYYTVPGEFKDVTGERDFLVYTNNLGAIISIKKFEKGFKDEDIEYIVNLTEETFKNTGKENIVINKQSFGLLGHPYIDGTFIRAYGYVNSLEYDMDIYLVNTNSGTIYMSIESFKDFYDVHSLVDNLCENYFIFS